MSYDLYVELDGKSRRDVDSLVEGELSGVDILDIYTRIQLLTAIAARNSKVKDHAISGDRKTGGGYKSLVHKMEDPKGTPYAKALIAPALAQMKNLGFAENAPDLSLLPPGSWFLQFTFTLAKPWISKDDDLFYVAESVNPVRKDKVFKVPMMSASGWKGSLRWTLMHTRLAQRKDKLTPEEFASERFAQTLLFGDEQGEEPAQAKGFARYVNALKPEARAKYEGLLRQYYGIEPEQPLPHHSGRLMFYSTFFDAIDVEVINPHSRETRAGTHPIYLESVPPGASGRFTLLYVPFDRIGKDKVETKTQVAEDLKLIVQGLQAMFTLYGFGAKTSSGFGVAEDSLVGQGSLTLHMEDLEEFQDKESPAEDHLQALQADMNAFVKRFDIESFPRWTNKELSASGWGKKRQSKYKKLRNRHPDWDAQVGQWCEATQADDANEESAPPSLTERTFASFSELLETSRRLESVLTTGGDA